MLRSEVKRAKLEIQKNALFRIWTLNFEFSSKGFETSFARHGFPAGAQMVHSLGGGGVCDEEIELICQLADGGFVLFGLDGLEEIDHAARIDVCGDQVTPAGVIGFAFEVSREFLVGEKLRAVGERAGPVAFLPK